MVSTKKEQRSKSKLPWFFTGLGGNPYRELDYVVVDIETTISGHKNLWRNDFLFGYAYHRDGTWEYVSDISNYIKLAQWCADHHAVFVAHNAKFELQFLAKQGFPIESLFVYDTMVAEKKIHSNNMVRLDLDSVAHRYGGKGKQAYIDLLMSSGVCPSEMPTPLIRKRCRTDVEDTHEIFKKQLDILENCGIIGVCITGNLLVSVLADIEMRGMYLDAELVRDLYKEANLQYSKLSEELNSLAPINYASPQQVAKLLYKELGFNPPMKGGRPYVGKPNDEFPEGVPKTDEEAIASLKPRTKKQKRFVELKQQETKLRKKLTTYFALFVRAVEEDNCYVHGSINQTVARTHRLSSSGPNLQNMDRTLKRVFTARDKGWKMRQEDFKQLEYRVAGFLAQCPVVLEEIHKGSDPHRLAVETIFAEEVKGLYPSSGEYKEFRNKAKPHTFKPLYGGMSGTKKEVAYYKAFIEKHYGIKEWHDSLLLEAEHTKEVVLPTGMRFFFPNAGYDRSGYFRNQTNIKNFPVQYFATGEIAIIATIFMWHRMKQARVNSFIVNEVHDSVIIEQDPEEEHIMDKIRDQAMITDVNRYLSKVYNIDFNYPLEVETEINDNWGYDK